MKACLKNTWRYVLIQIVIYPRKGYFCVCVWSIQNTEYHRNWGNVNSLSLREQIFGGRCNTWNSSIHLTNTECRVAFYLLWINGVCCPFGVCLLWGKQKREKQQNTEDQLHAEEGWGEVFAGTRHKVGGRERGRPGEQWPVPSAGPGTISLHEHSRWLLPVLPGLCGVHRRLSWHIHWRAESICLASSQLLFLLMKGTPFHFWIMLPASQSAEWRRGQCRSQLRKKRKQFVTQRDVTVHKVTRSWDELREVRGGLCENF